MLHGNTTPTRSIGRKNPRHFSTTMKKNVLAMSYAGMTIEQISKRLCKSVESVKKIQTKHFFKPFSQNPATGTVDFHQKW